MPVNSEAWLVMVISEAETVFVYTTESPASRLRFGVVSRS
jgi:hypothetical protein